MREHRLLDRIRLLEAQPEARLRPESRARRITSIREHLQCLLNTRQGSADTCPDLGLPDMTDLPSSVSPENLRAIERSIRQVIEKYETRLTGVQVHFRDDLPNAPTLSFSISGRLADVEDPTPAVFETMVESGGHISLTG